MTEITDLFVFTSQLSNVDFGLFSKNDRKHTFLVQTNFFKD